MYYALWYYTNFEKSTNAISTDIKLLNDLQIESELNLDCFYHKYKHLIKNISIQPIKCYVYINKNLIELGKDDESDESDKYDFTNLSLYSSYNSILVNNYDNHFILEEILIYLSKEDHEIWLKLYSERDRDSKKMSVDLTDTYPSFFFNETISHNSIECNKYYEEGIINA